MKPDELKAQGLQLLQRHFDVPDELATTESPDPKQFLTELPKPVIRRMLDQSFDQLLNVLYRIDLPERTVVEILEQAPPGEIADRLSEAIADRQLEKISLRERFRAFGD